LFASLREQSIKDGSKPLTLAQVKLVLSDNPVVQATAPPPKPEKFVYQSVVAGAANDSWQTFFSRLAPADPPGSRSLMSFRDEPGSSR
jgi:hypothetical protein